MELDSHSVSKSTISLRLIKLNCTQDAFRLNTDRKDRRSDDNLVDRYYRYK
jgi:hypothetical protein